MPSPSPSLLPLLLLPPRRQQQVHLPRSRLQRPVPREQALPPRGDRDGAERVVIFAGGGGRRRRRDGNQLQLEGDDGVRGEVAVGHREGQERCGEAPVPVGVDGRGLGGRAELLPFAAVAAREKAGESRPHPEGGRGGAASEKEVSVPSSSFSEAPRERGAPPGSEAVDAETDLCKRKKKKRKKRLRLSSSSSNRCSRLFLLSLFSLFSLFTFCDTSQLAWKNRELALSAGSAAAEAGTSCRRRASRSCSDEEFDAIEKNLVPLACFFTLQGSTLDVSPASGRVGRARLRRRWGCLGEQSARGGGSPPSVSLSRREGNERRREK